MSREVLGSLLEAHKVLTTTQSISNPVTEGTAGMMQAPGMQFCRHIRQQTLDLTTIVNCLHCMTANAMVSSLTTLGLGGGSFSSSAWLGMKPVSTLPFWKSSKSSIMVWYWMVVGTPLMTSSFSARRMRLMAAGLSSAHTISFPSNES